MLFVRRRIIQTNNAEEIFPRRYFCQSHCLRVSVSAPNYCALVASESLGCPPHQQMCRETVPQTVRSGLFGYSGRPHRFSHCFLNRLIRNVVSMRHAGTGIDSQFRNMRVESDRRCHKPTISGTNKFFASDSLTFHHLLVYDRCCECPIPDKLRRSYITCTCSSRGKKKEFNPTAN